MTHLEGLKTIITDDLPSSDYPELIAFLQKEVGAIAQAAKLQYLETIVVKLDDAKAAIESEDFSMDEQLDAILEAGFDMLDAFVDELTELTEQIQGRSQLGPEVDFEETLRTVVAAELARRRSAVHQCDVQHCKTGVGSAQTRHWSVAFEDGTELGAYCAADDARTVVDVLMKKLNLAARDAALVGMKGNAFYNRDTLTEVK